LTCQIILYVNIKEGDMGRGNSPGKSDRVATIEVLKEKEIMIMSPQQQVIINKPEPKVFWVQEVLLQRSHKETGIGRSHPGSHGPALN
jgi:hypothetical protein